MKFQISVIALLCGASISSCYRLHVAEKRLVELHQRERFNFDYLSATKAEKGHTIDLEMVELRLMKIEEFLTVIADDILNEEGETF